MPCPTCIAALEQGATALREVAAFRPELLPPLPEAGLATPAAVAEWLVRTAGRCRQALDAAARDATNPPRSDRPT